MKNILVGSLIVLIGVVIFLNSFQIININLLFDGWWTLFIIVPCLINIYKNKKKKENIIGLLIGVFLLFINQNILNSVILFKLILPCILIVIGFIFIKNKYNTKELLDNLFEDSDVSSTFTYQDINYRYKEFNGVKLDAVFGGMKCDLRKSKLKDKAKIHANVIFGGINIIVPKDVLVEVSHKSIFGGVSNSNKEVNKYKKVIYVDAICLFGGISINDKVTESD